MNIPFPFNCWCKTSTSAVMAMKSCSLVWVDRMSHTPQRCSGRSNLGSPADHRNLSSYFKNVLKLDGHMDVLVLLHSMNLFIIHCIVWFLLN